MVPLACPFLSSRYCLPTGSSQPASSLTQMAGWSKPRSSLEAGWSMATLWVERVKGESHF